VISDAFKLLVCGFYDLMMQKEVIQLGPPLKELLFYHHVLSSRIIYRLMGFASLQHGNNRWGKKQSYS